MLKFYNTLTRKKEIFKSIKNGRVGIYSCGPTVYDYDHLGHAWKYTQDDLLRRVLKYNGYKVKNVMNITDVGHLTSDADTGDDKMEKSAQEKKKTAWEIADYFSKIFFENRKKLNLLHPHVVCKATDHIKEIIELIKILIKKGYGYKIDDGIYFDVQKFPNYGKLSGNTLEKLKAGARIEINFQKRHPADFAIWKFTSKETKRQMEWNSPWGKGFPGWHIECSAMSMKYLGKSFDIHTGGEDNIFPHHECEIAQSEAVTNKKFVNYWFHPRFLKIEGQKMSKSLKNFFTIKDIERKNFSPLVLRYLFLTAHYRSPFNFTWQKLKMVENSLEKIREFINKLQTQNHKTQINSKLFEKLIFQTENDFKKAINDDLNFPKALAIIFNLIKEINKLGKIDKKNVKKILDLIKKFDLVLGLNLIKKIEKIKIPFEIKKLAKEREKYRQEKQWQKADEIRKKIETLGYEIEDTEKGSAIKKSVK